MNRRDYLAGVTGAATMMAWTSERAFAQQRFDGAPTAAPIKLIAPFPPGGTVDILARALTLSLTPALNRPMVVENKGGAGGTVGADIAAHSPADGNTLLFATAHHAIAQSVYPKLGYDIQADFAPVAFLGRVNHVLICNKALPVTNVLELVDYLKKKPDRLNYGTPGSGTLHHLMAEQFKAASGTSMQHVPYKGSGQAMVDLIAGQIHVYFETMPSALQHIRNKSVRALAVTSQRRSDQLPNVPTVAESGLPGYDASSWYGLLVPKGTPPRFIDQLNKAVNSVYEDPNFVVRWTELGAERGGGTPQDLGKLLSDEVVRWSRVATTANIKVE